MLKMAQQILKYHGVFGIILVIAWAPAILQDVQVPPKSRCPRRASPEKVQLENKC